METPDPSRKVIHFGVFDVDLRARELRKQGIKIKLQEQPFSLLVMLLERPGEVIAREDMQKRIWPADTFVDFDQGLNNAIKRLRDALSDSVDTPRFIETIPRRGYRFICGAETSSAGRIRSLAVLPLENLSRDPEQEYFAEGLTEALITTLAKIGELRVVSRTSAMQYKGIHRPLREIARELQVDAIVEGTVLRAEQRVRITAQLIDAPNETHLWAETYERDLRDVLALQSEVAQAIAREVRVKLTPQDLAHFQHHRVDPEAYEAYLKGRYHWNRRSREGFGKAVQSFQTAIAKDPTYASAYAGLADCFTALSAWGFVPADEGCGKGRGLAQKALELDHASAEAHASLAFASMYVYDFSAAESEFERSIELDPRYASAHEWFGLYLGTMGRYEEAYTELKRALRLDPHSSAIQFISGFVYLYSHRYNQAIEQFRKIIDLDPTFAQGYGGLGWALTYIHQHQQAVAALQKSVELAQRAPTFVAVLGEAYAAAGRVDEARNILERLNKSSKERYVMPYFVSRIYAALGEKEETFCWLEASYLERATNMMYLQTEPRFDNLRLDPRFQDLVRRMNFPP